MKKIYTFRLLYGGEDDFVRDIEIESGQTLYDLHISIQDNLNYDPSQMASFFLTDSSWEKGEEIPLINMTESPGTKTMEKVIINENNIENLDRLLYVFDYLSNRGFFIELVKTGEPAKGVTYPRCVRSEGDPPKQMEMDNDPSFLTDDISGEEDDDISFESLNDLPEM